MKWILCDYGEVLSLPQSALDQQALEEEAGCFGQRFWAAYWQHRPGYDRGDTDVTDYWSLVLGFRPDRRKLSRLIEIDVLGWLRTNTDTLAATARAVERGLSLAILSNAPLAVADAIDAAPWASAFSPRLFSSRLKLIKPEPEIYVAALRALDADPAEVTFFDDRPANIAAAIEAGIQAHLFSGAIQIDEVATSTSTKE